MVGIIYEKYLFFEIKKNIAPFKKFQHRKVQKDIGDRMNFIENFKNER